MEFGKVYTYKDAEEAKKLIGKKVLFHSMYRNICECPNDKMVGVLEAVKLDNTGDSYSDVFGIRSKLINRILYYQFIREIV